MSDYSERGAAPVEDAVVDDPPTEAEVLDEQRRRYPEQVVDHPDVAPPPGRPPDDEQPHDEQPHDA